MATKTVAGKTVQVNEEGFMLIPAEWTKEIAVEIEQEEAAYKKRCDAGHRSIY